MTPAKPLVAVFGRKRDPEVQALLAALRARDAAVGCVDFHNFPRFNLSSFDSSGPGPFDDLHLPSPLALDDVDLVLLRTRCFVDLDDQRAATMEAAAVAAYYRAEHAKLAYQVGLLRNLARRLPVINPVDSALHHAMKGWQQHLLRRAGLPVPDAIVTSDPEQARRFAARFPRGAVAKPQASGARVALADEAWLQAWGSGAQRRPTMFQRFVRGRSFRAYVLGGEVACAAYIRTDGEHVDWRGHTRRMEPFEPDAELRDTLRRAVRLVNMPYCGVDLELDERSGRTWLLDLNPSALLTGASRLMGVDLAGAVAAYSLGVLRRGGQVWLPAGSLPTLTNSTAVP